MAGFPVLRPGARRLSWSRVATQSSGLAALYNNETCGTLVPLEVDPVVPRPEVDGGNDWEACSRLRTN